MKRKLLAVVLGLIALPVAGWAQENCFDCVLGIYDDEQLTRNFGTIEQGVPKDVYVGLKLTGGLVGVTGIELSITGISLLDNLFIVEFVGLPQADAVVGTTVEAPADTTASSSGTGGVNLAWSVCQEGSNRAIARLTLLALGPVAPDHVLRVLRKFPTSDPAWLTPILVKCDPPDYTPVRLTGGCYVANPTGNPTGCQLPVAEGTWSGVKELFR
jgi:hypothetical protein